MSLDALSSVAYGPEAIVLILVAAGTAAVRLTLPIAMAITVLLMVLVVSYRQVIAVHPNGGGAYAVAKKDLGRTVSLLAAASLVVDYVLTVAVSLAAGAASLGSVFPVMSHHLLAVTDASNADTLTKYTLGHLTRCRGLILDLRDLDFFGTEGFSALHRVSVCCARAGIGWAVVSGEAVSRMLRIGDPQGLLPAASTLEAALATVQDQSYRPPQPIASRRDPGQSSRCERTVCLVCGGTQQVRHEQRTLTEAIALARWSCVDGG